MLRARLSSSRLGILSDWKSSFQRVQSSYLSGTLSVYEEMSEACLLIALLTCRMAESRKNFMSNSFSWT